MKIKSKLIAGGLMTTVACALVGSITGTFAWIQYSNSATASVHGVSINVKNNIEWNFDPVNHPTDWHITNMTWNDIKAGIDATKLDDQTGEFKLLPVSNGANNGSQALVVNNNAETWYGNPDGTSDTLPAATSGYLQFSFYVRIAETDDGQNYEYPAGKLYVTDIAGNTEDDKMDFALRMHVHLGETDSADSFFLVNPTTSATEDVLLSADYKKVTQYDWMTEAQVNAAAETITYKLPDRTTSTDAGHLITLPHSTVLHTVSNGVVTNAGKNADIPASTNQNQTNGCKVTVTLWLEGFALDPTTAVKFTAQEISLAQTAHDEGWTAGVTPKDSTNPGGDKYTQEELDAIALAYGKTTNDNKVGPLAWWNFNNSIEKSIKAGFELTAIRNA